MGTYGRNVLDAKTGHPIQVTADGAPVWHPVGITVDWDEVAAVEDEDVELNGGTVIKVGQKYLRYGQVLVKDSGSGKWVPWSGQALKRGETVIVNETVLKEGLVPGLSKPISDHPAVIDGGLCWKSRIIAVDAADDEEAAAQVETLTVVGAVGAAGEGTLHVTVTAAGMQDSPKLVPVAVANDDTAAEVAGKIRAALELDLDVNTFFTVGGAGADVVLTAREPAPNDPTMNIALALNDVEGPTPVANSANTTAGSTGLTVSTGPVFADLEAAMPLLRYA